MRFRAWAFGAAVGAVVIVGASLGPSRSYADVATLREAWVLHRLQGQPDRASAVYRRLHEDELAAPDLRCRAAIGLGLIERDGGEERAALEWFERASRVPGAGQRWVRSALDEIAAIRRGLESEADPHLPLDLETQVGDLERDVATYRVLIEERDQELGRRDAIIQRLRDSHEGAERARDIQAELNRSRAAQFLESIAEREKETQRVTRHLVAAALARAMEHMSEGRGVFAYNEVKRALEIDPLNRGAKDLEARCRALMAQSTSERSLVRTSQATAKSPRPELVVEVMSAYLEEGKRLYRKGRIVGAIGAFERVLEEYANSPTALTEEQLSTIVAPAEHYLKGCFEDRGAAADTLRLRARRSDLLAAVQEGASRILEQQRALDQIDSSLEQILVRDPEEGIRSAASEAATQLREGVEAMEKGSMREARLAFRDVLIVLNWFPALDPDQQLRGEVTELLQELEALGPREP
ncbi:MAG: hypothetical protein AB7O52_09175 [Planctomycetota bacterium]